MKDDPKEVNKDKDMKRDVESATACPKKRFLYVHQLDPKYPSEQGIHIHMTILGSVILVEILL